VSRRARRFVAPLCGTVLLVLAGCPAASAATLHVAPGGADRGDCVGSACAGVEYAYGQAAAGDVIELAAGEYPRQRVPAGTKAVTIRGLRGNRLRQLDNSAHNVTFDRLDLDAGGATTVDSAVFENRGVDNVTFRNGRIGNVTNQKGAVVAGTNFTFDRVEFHDVVATIAGTHMECVFAIGVPGMTVRSSRFRNCAIMDLFFLYGSWWEPLPPPYGGIRIENNVFGHVLNEDGSWNHYPLYIGQTGNDVLDGWTVRHNTFEQNASLGTSHSRAVNSRWVGNIGGWDCIAGMAYSHNVGTRCGATDTQVSPAASTRTSTAPFGWADPERSDFRLTAGSPAIDAGDPGDAPATDIDGNARDARPDAGAHELGGAGALPRRARPRIRLARLRPALICRRPSRSCPAVSELRVRPSRGARVSVHVRRLRAAGRPAAERRLVADGVRRAARIRARGLRPGRYSVLVSAVDAAGARSATTALRLRVR
jgi:hypothetical protein